MIVTGQAGSAIKVYESNPNREDGTTDLKDPGLSFTHRVTWHPADNPVDPPCYTYPPSDAYPGGYSWGWPEGLEGDLAMVTSEGRSNRCLDRSRP